MKKIICLLIMIIQMSYINTYAENIETNIPSVEEFESNNYVVYQNADTGNTELAVIYYGDSEELTLTAESNKQLYNEEILKFYYMWNKSVPDIERPKLTVNADYDILVTKYIAVNNAWVEVETVSESVLCDNLKIVLDSNIVIIEKLHNPIKTWLNDNYTGKDFALFYEDESQDSDKRYIAFSDDAFNYNKKVLLPYNDYKCYFKNIVYGNGVYVAVGRPEHTIYETKVIKNSNFNRIMYVISEDMKILHKEDILYYRECVGFYDGYFYFKDEYSKSENFKKEYKKSTDGINYVNITENEFNNVLSNVSLKRKYSDNGYILCIESGNIGTNTLLKDEKKYTIEYESDNMKLCSGGQRRGDGWICSIISEDAQKVYLSYDGIYPAARLPEYDYSKVYFFRADNYIYAQTEREYYYKIYAPQTDNTYVILNDKILAFEQPPVIEEGRTLVPMRFLFEQMGADVEWNAETKTAKAKLNNTAVSFSIDDTNAEVNSKPVTMDVPAQLVNGKTMVPLRFLSEELGYTVTWDEETRTAVIE